MTGTNKMEAVFTSELLNEDLKQEMKTKGTWREGCPVALERLRVVKFAYYDFEEREHEDGEMVVLDAVSEHVKAIFEVLHTIKFPIGKACRIEHYGGSDEMSLADNNSAAFNHREITGGGLPSLHSYGVAIDINPIQNPYIAPQDKRDPTQGFAKVLPAEGLNYLNRTNLRPGMAEGVVEIFAKHGFKVWGGQWNNPIDWQHFQPSRPVAQLLAAMQPEHAEALFNMYVKEHRMLNAVDARNNKLIHFYESNPQQFMEALQAYEDVLAGEVQQAYELIERLMK